MKGIWAASVDTAHVGQTIVSRSCYFIMKGKGMVLYDGYCNLCSRTVRWIVRNDPQKRFSFQPFPEPESRLGSEKELETVMLEMDGKRYERSTAVIRIATGLRFPWPLLGVLFAIPRFIRDPLYNLVARNRKRWFGIRETCYLPDYPESDSGTEG